MCADLYRFVHIKVFNSNSAKNMFAHFCTCFNMYCSRILSMYGLNKNFLAVENKKKLWAENVFSEHVKNYSKCFLVLTIVRSAAAVLRLAALRPQLRLRPEVKPQLLWKNPHSEEKLENKSN